MSTRSENDMVRIAEAIVHQSWHAMLWERRAELAAMLQRAFDRCDEAERSLTRAQRYGDPQSIAASQADLERARGAVEKAQLTWRRTRKVFDAELGRPAGLGDEDGG